MTPKQIVDIWVKRFNLGDADGLSELYHDDAVNHQVTQEPIEGRDPNGLRGCGFFTVRDGRIAFQRGYWDKLAFLKLHGLPIE